MRQNAKPISLAGSSLNEVRHVCALFNSDEEEYRLLLPFIKDGFECGDRAIHVINPNQHCEHVDRLASAGINSVSAQQSGQLQLCANSETYIRDGHSDQDQMLEVFEQLAGGDPGRGFPLSRIVCRMDWAAEGGTHVDNLIEFESRVNGLWARHDDAVICTYHLSQFSGDAVSIFYGPIRLSSWAEACSVIRSSSRRSNSYPNFARDEREASRATWGCNMETSREAPLETAKLRRCLNDLISILALPAMWTEKDPQHIASTLADTLLGMLNLVFVLVCLNDPDGRPSLEVFWVEKGGKASEIRNVLACSLGNVPLDWAPRSRVSGEYGDLYVATARLGIRGEMGVIADGSERLDFPDQSEILLLDVATNQAAVGLQHALAIGEQRRVASNLEDHVRQRTRELAAANEDLKKSERNLKLIIDTIPAFVWCVLPDGSNEFISKAWHAHTGVPPEESRGWGWMSVFHPDDLPGLMKKWGELLTSGEPDQTQARIRRHDGIYRWFLIRAEPFRDEPRNIVRWYGTSTDIEDRKGAEQALESRGQDLKLIIDTIPTLSWSTDANGSVELLSRPWLDFTGLSVEQALGFGWSVAVHPGDAQHLLQYWQSALNSGSQVDVEARLRRSDGVYRWFLFRANPLRDETGKIIKWYGANLDIEDRKRAEEELRRNEEFLSKAQRLTQSGSFCWHMNTDEVVFFRRSIQHLRV